MLRHPQTPERLILMPEFWTGGMIPHPGLWPIGFWFYQSLGGIAPVQGTRNSAGDTVFTVPGGCYTFEALLG